MVNQEISTVDRRWLAIFEDRYGSGAYQRLIGDLRQPCVTFAAIAKHFDVTRERVRQWQMRLLPGAPRGHQRQRLCAAYRRKRRLLEDPLFRAFHRHAQAHVERGRIELIKSSNGYRRRTVQIDRRMVALRDARRSPSAVARSSTPAYVLAGYRGAADFLYYRLAPDDYLLLPTRELPAAGTTFIDGPESRYYVFKNTFAALAVMRHRSA